MDQVLNVKLALADVGDLEGLYGFDRHTQLLTSTYSFNTHIILVFLADGTKKHAGVAGIFNEVPPHDGKWNLEVAVELPDLLPAIDGRSEAVIDVRDGHGVIRQLFLSNRISRFHYQDGDDSKHVLVPRSKPWHGTAEVVGSGGQKLIAAEEQLRTVAGMRFAIGGDTAEHAFESSIRTCIETLFGCINVVVQATRESHAGIPPTARSIHWGCVATVYLLMSGDGKAKPGRLALNGPRVVLYSKPLTGDKATHFRAIADGSLALSDVDRLIGEALSSWEDGEYEFAFLQIVIAAEIATQRTVRAECLRRGVSRTKLNDNRKETTYSWALNIGLPLCFPIERRPNADLVAAMNSARSKRNDLMHEGTFAMGRSELGQLITDTRNYVGALRAAEASSKAASEQHRE